MWAVLLTFLTPPPSLWTILINKAYVVICLHGLWMTFWWAARGGKTFRFLWSDLRFYFSQLFEFSIKFCILSSTLYAQPQNFIWGLEYRNSVGMVVFVIEVDFSSPRMPRKFFWSFVRVPPFGPLSNSLVTLSIHPILHFFGGHDSRLMVSCGLFMRKVIFRQWVE